MSGFLNKYGSKLTGSRKILQANIGGTYRKMRRYIVYRNEVTNGVYIQKGKEQEGKDIRTLRSNDNGYLW